MQEIKVKRVIAEQIGEPKNDGSPGSALYSIPFELNRTPSSLWAEIFERVWESPPSYTQMHRPGIAHVEGDVIVLDGTTIEEVEQYHKKTLQLCVAETNRMEAKELEKRGEMRKAEEAEEERNASWRREVEEKARNMRFDEQE